uniref:Lipoprotein n=1 Tax=Macrostomum lignano TaxID=282301 RepID=A0A1I8F672_9PLAT
MYADLYQAYIDALAEIQTNEAERSHEPPAPPRQSLWCRSSLYCRWRKLSEAADGCRRLAASRFPRTGRVRRAAMAWRDGPLLARSELARLNSACKRQHLVSNGSPHQPRNGFRPMETSLCHILVPVALLAVSCDSFGRGNHRAIDATRPEPTTL